MGPIHSLDCSLFGCNLLSRTLFHKETTTRSSVTSSARTWQRYHLVQENDWTKKIFQDLPGSSESAQHKQIFSAPLAAACTAAIHVGGARSHECMRRSLEVGPCQDRQQHASLTRRCLDPCQRAFRCILVIGRCGYRVKLRCCDVALRNHATSVNHQKLESESVEGKESARPP